MPIPDALETAGTSLRATNVILQALDSPDLEQDRPSIDLVKSDSNLVIQSLNVLGAGIAQDAVSGSIRPTAGVMGGAEESLLQDRAALDDIREADLPDQFAEFMLLRNRIANLRSSVASAALR